MFFAFNFFRQLDHGCVGEELYPGGRRRAAVGGAARDHRLLLRRQLLHVLLLHPQRVPLPLLVLVLIISALQIKSTKIFELTSSF